MNLLEPQRHRGTEKFNINFLCALLCVSVSLW